MIRDADSAIVRKAKSAVKRATKLKNLKQYADASKSDQQEGALATLSLRHPLVPAKIRKLLEAKEKKKESKKNSKKMRKHGRVARAKQRSSGGKKELDKGKKGSDQRKNYGEIKNRSSMLAAIKEVESVAQGKRKGGKSVSAIAKKHGISKTVLYDTLKGKRPLGTSSGRNQAIPNHLEAVIVQNAKDLDDRGQGMSMHNIKSVGRQISELYKLPTSIKCSDKWLAGLFRRGNDLAKRRQQAFSRTRAGGLNPPSIQEFFDLLAQLLARIEKKNGEHHCGACIMNLDEVGINAEAMKGNVIASRKGKRQVHKVQAKAKSGNRLSMVSLITAGDFNPNEFFIFEGKKASAQQILPNGDLQCLQLGTPYAFAESGYLTDDVWEAKVVPWIVSQVQQMKADLRKPDHVWVLLVLDGCGSHCYIPDALEVLHNNRIEILRMPSNTSSCLQPLDVAYFRPLKADFRAFLDLNQILNVNGLSKYQLAKWVQVCWRRISKSRNENGETLGQIGMRVTGIYPLNRNWVAENMGKLKKSDAYDVGSERAR